jgi:hypothetical protein
MWLAEGGVSAPSSFTVSSVLAAMEWVWPTAPGHSSNKPPSHFRPLDPTNTSPKLMYSTPLRLADEGPPKCGWPKEACPPHPPSPCRPCWPPWNGYVPVRSHGDSPTPPHGKRMTSTSRPLLLNRISFLVGRIVARRGLGLVVIPGGRVWLSTLPRPWIGVWLVPWKRARVGATTHIPIPVRSHGDSPTPPHGKRMTSTSRPLLLNWLSTLPRPWIGVWLVPWKRARVGVRLLSVARENVSRIRTRVPQKVTHHTPFLVPLTAASHTFSRATLSRIGMWVVATGWSRVGVGLARRGLGLVVIPGGRVWLSSQALPLPWTSRWPQPTFLSRYGPMETALPLPMGRG